MTHCSLSAEEFVPCKSCRTGLDQIITAKNPLPTPRCTGCNWMSFSLGSVDFDQPHSWKSWSEWFNVVTQTKLICTNDCSWVILLLYTEHSVAWFDGVASVHVLHFPLCYLNWKLPCYTSCITWMIRWCCIFSPLRDNIDDFKVQTAKHPNMGSAPLRPHSEQSRDRASKRLSSESNGTSEGGVGSSTPVEVTALEESFRRFAIHGDTRATGKEMHGKNWSKLCKDCGVIDGKNITLTDVDIVFSKVK